MHELTVKKKVFSLVIAATVMATGLLIFKYGLMKAFGPDILYDASFHLTLTIFILYLGWYFVDRNESWRIPYFIFALAVIVIISLQRIIDNAHNDVGLLAGLVISIIAIIISRWRYFHNKFRF